MQIVIPMSGFGERFRRAGYTVPKPLIEVEGKPIIAHVIDMFPDEKKFLFICNQEHLDNPAYHMREILQKYCPAGRIIGIPPHKLGPVHAVQQAEHLIDMNEPVIVNYCDFTCYWDWRHFKQFVLQTRCAGAVPAYKGFHPHTLGTTNYAYMREQNGWMLDIQEKKPYTNNRMEEYASSGTYYFSSGKLMSEAFRHTVAENWQVGGEYYVSLAYKALLANKQPITVYPLQHFMQWGTPEDLAEYNHWSAVFRQLSAHKPMQKQPKGSFIIPMAGMGKRFADEGYKKTKPLIPVSGKPMVISAAKDLPAATSQVFVLREDMPEYESITQEIRRIFPHALLKTIPQVTEGQACTALIGLNSLNMAGMLTEPITIGACDNGVLYNAERLAQLLDDPTIDVIVWGARGHVNAIRHPGMFGWIAAEKNNRITSVSVKTPLGNPAHDPIVTGTFTFRHAGDFQHTVEHLIARNGRINGEFYIDACINDAIAMGLRCVLFEVDSFISWGTPNDLKTFEYWQSCFHKWNSHPYRLEKDQRIPSSAIPLLESRYKTIIPDLPE